MPTQTKRNKTTTVWVNARFLDRPVTGVERVARELLGALAADLLDERGCWIHGGQRFQLKLLAPASCTAASPWPNLELHRAGRFDGHAWEQLDLPRLTRGGWLLSLCNTGPLMKRRHVLFLHDAQPFVIPGNFSLAFRLWYRLAFRVAGRFARHILVNSRFTGGELSRHVGIPREKLELCSLGSEHVDREDGDAADLSRFDLPQEPFLLAVASANLNKNFRSVLQALDMLGESAPPCVIVGQTGQRQFGDVELDPGRVSHLGYVSDAELLALYRRAMCLVFPSFYEGFGLPPLEAMATGCPVIASQTSAMPEICGDAVTYCNPHDYGSLARAIRRVSTSAARREVMIERGLARAARFSWRDSAGRLLQLLARAAADPGHDGVIEPCTTARLTKTG